MNKFRVFLLSAFFLSAFLSGKVPATKHTGGTKVFDDLKELLVRVKAAESISSPKNSYGTGFVVDKSGVLATNYHVISDSVMQPGDQYKIIVELGDATNLEAQLIDFSVIDDLALIKINKTFSTQLEFEPGEPSNGDRIFSLGLPHDITMVINEGTYNGVLRMGPYETIHVSTPLNAGMSGGPSVTSGGRLAGVNVARVLSANNLSFIVPSTRLATMVHQANLKTFKPLDKAAATKKLYAQLESSQVQLVDSLLNAKSQKVEIWKNRNIEVPAYLKCWSSGEDQPALPYVLKNRTCRLDHALFLASELETGTYNVDVSLLEASRINRFSVAKLWGSEDLLQSFIERREETKKFGDLDARDLFTPYECRQGFLKAPFGGIEKTLRTGLCFRKYKKAGNLYDFYYRFSDFSSDLKMSVEVNHSAVSLSNMKKLIAYWTEKFK